MMRRLVTAAALLGALAGCGGGGVPESAAAAQCRQQAYDDPTVKELMILRISSPSNGVDLDQRYNLAVRQAEQHCLTGRGIEPQGGVAPVVRQY